MYKRMERILRCFGQQATLYSKGVVTKIQIIFQSVNSRSWQNMEHGYSALGRIPRGQYLCILPAGSPAQVGDSLILRGIEYEIRKLENKYLGSRIVYVWGLCVEKGA